jgi:RimJ/RimL family protein N-acetyltransferase
MKSEFLPGSRLYLRPLELDDGRAVVEWMNDREVLRYLTKTIPINSFREDEFLRTLYKDEKNVHLGIVVRDDHRLIGRVSLVNLDIVGRTAELSLVIGDRSAWGKGYGVEADGLMLRYGFDFLNLHKVYAWVLEGHHHSVRVLEENRLVREGVLREHIYRDGKYHNVLLYSILAPEFRR